KASTTPSRSSSAEPTAIVTKNTSSSKSAQPSPVIFDEPFFMPHRLLTQGLILESGLRFPVGEGLDLLLMVEECVHQRCRESLNCVVEGFNVAIEYGNRRRDI